MIELTDTNAAPERTAVAMGLFDGVHAGHREVIRRAAELPGTAPAVFTFDTVSAKGMEKILSREMKFALLEELGVRYVYSPEFGSFRDMSGEDFVRQVLGETLRAAYAVCGEDFRFGRGAKWGTSELEALCRERGIQLIVVPPVREPGGEKMSSTLIRELIRQGDIERANRLLCSPFGYSLSISRGRQIGRTLDFPTINQYLPGGQVLPRFGVYASVTEICGVIYKSVTNIGIKPTVGTDAPLSETYLIGYQGGELYGETATVRLTAFIRPERKFDSLEELKHQIAEDTANRIKN